MTISTLIDPFFEHSNLLRFVVLLLLPVIYAIQMLDFQPAHETLTLSQ
jgi:hypothetical protein